MKIIKPKLSFVFPIVTIASLLQFCAPTATTNTSNVAYYEDLSEYRMAYDEPSDSETSNTNEVEETESDKYLYIQPTHDIGEELDTVINRIIESRKDIKYLDGYSIQLYSGNNRDKANEVKVRAYEVSEELKPRVSYDQPNYKVRVGKYYNRLEANADFVLLQKHFRRAVLIPAKIKIETVD